ncbi:MAG: hydroxyisourate hydrolase [Nocardiopsaceae bacterium]|jgi:5-hydroxyisourate hydrolase|nr:hydroxyisourate hydrolase [Nocardiopsaceae bacterium]
MSAVTTHVLDTMRGEPASGVLVRLERAGDGGLELGRGTTNADGRIADFGVASLSAGTYRLVFETGAYLETAGRGQGGAAGGTAGAVKAFFPEVVVTFAADGLRPRYHVPLLLSPYSYSTYRGS